MERNCYRSEEALDVFGFRVDDDVVDVALFDLAQNVAIILDGRLPNVHLHLAVGRRPDEILQP